MKSTKNHFEKDRAFSRRFEKIEVSEPSVEETRMILKGLKPYYEKHHGLHYTDQALRRQPTCPPNTSMTGFCRTRPSTSSTKPAPFCG